MEKSCPSMPPPSVVETRKRRGAYYTSSAVAEFLVRAVVRSPTMRVLEPCFGDGVFIDASEAAARELGGRLEVVGVDIDPQAVERVRAARPGRALYCRDFLTVERGELGWFDAVVGNPPFVRYHRYRGRDRDLGLLRCRQAGVRVSALTSAWLPFLVHATVHLRPGGRMAVVAPYELTYARYAKPFIRYLCANFARVRIFEYHDPLFPDLNESTVLLLADGWGSSSRCIELVRAHSIEDTPPEAAWSLPGHVIRLEEWTEAHDRTLRYGMPGDARALFGRVWETATPLGELASLTIGYVTGANDWFHLTPHEVGGLGLVADVAPTVVKAGVLRSMGLTVRAADLDGAGAGARTRVFAPREPLSAAAACRVAHGESLGVHMRYKCRVRRPWWRVPGLSPHDFAVPVLSHGAPRIVALQGVLAANSLLVGDMRADVDPCLLAAASLTTFAALSAEVTGHRLGGGALKLEPFEARRWRIALGPPPVAGEMASLDRLIRAGDWGGARALADELFLVRPGVLSPAGVECLRRALAALREERRRRARGA